MIFGVILLILILILIFRDTILKLIKGNKINFLNSKKVKSREFSIDSFNIKSLFIDVLDTEVKILFDKEIDKISVKTMHLVDDFSYDVKYDQENITILKNDMDNYKKIGTSGRILIKVPKKDIIEKLNILVINGDIEIHDMKISDVLINSHNGIIKVDSLEGKDINIFKGSGDVNLSHLNVDMVNLEIKEGNGDFVDVYGKNINVNIESGDFDFANCSEVNYKINSLNVNILNGKENIKLDKNLLC